MLSVFNSGSESELRTKYNLVVFRILTKLAVVRLGLGWALFALNLNMNLMFRFGPTPNPNFISKTNVR